MQVKYVVELARALAQHPAVYRVDLLTRLILDPNVDPSYSEPEECIWKAPDEKGLGGAYIERLACGPPKKYLRCWTLSGASDALMHAAMLGKRKAWCPDPQTFCQSLCDNTSNPYSNTTYAGRRSSGPTFGNLQIAPLPTRGREPLPWVRQAPPASCTRCMATMLMPARLQP